MLSDYFFKRIKVVIRNSASFGCIPGLRDPIRKAINKIQRYLDQGYVFVFESDVKNFFPSISREKAFRILSGYLEDGSLTPLINEFLNFEIAGSDMIKPEERFLFSLDEGIAQGCVFSPLIANLYLADLDTMFDAEEGIKMVRYMDDFIVFGKTDKKRTLAEQQIRRVIAEKGLALSKEKTFIHHMATEEISFLGLAISQKEVRIEVKTIDKLKDRISGVFRGPKEKKVFNDEAGRYMLEQVTVSTIFRKERACHEQELWAKRRDKEIILLARNLNRMLRGWYGYYQSFIGSEQQEEILNHIAGEWHKYFRKVRVSYDMLPKTVWFSAEVLMKKSANIGVCS